MVTDLIHVPSSVALVVENQKWDLAPGQDPELDNQDRPIICAAAQYIDDRRGGVEQDLQRRPKQREYCSRVDRDRILTGDELGRK